ESGNAAAFAVPPVPHLNERLEEIFSFQRDVGREPNDTASSLSLLFDEWRVRDRQCISRVDNRLARHRNLTCIVPVGLSCLEAHGCSRVRTRRGSFVAVSTRR